MTDSPIETAADAWRDDAGISDDDFFAPLGRGDATRPEGDFRFQGPQGRYNLTWPQEAFARHYAACGNGAEAARRAGYSVANARFIAYENLKDSRIRWRIRAIAGRREARRRAEAAYVIRMINAAMEMALRQNLPNTMIRALAHMARLGGLDRPAAAPPVQKSDDDESWLDSEAALALLPADVAGVLQAAVLDEPHQAAVASEEKHHPGRAAGPSRGPVEGGGVLWGAARAKDGQPDAIGENVEGPEADGPAADVSETVPHISLHSPTSGETSGDPGASVRLAAAGAAGRLPAAKQGERPGPEGGEPWSS